MIKSVSLLFAIVLIVAISIAHSERTLPESDEDMLFNYKTQQRLLDILKGQRNKRSDIDSRLMELQAKIELVKAFQKMPAGHGKFDFDKIGKRFLDPVKNMELLELAN
jgi:hypothetical protein